MTADDARLLPRLRAGADGGVVDRQRLLRGQADALLSAAAVVPSGEAKIRHKAEAGDLRGIPVIGPGVGGVQPGSSPTSAIGRVDRERERRAAAEDVPAYPMVACV